MACKNCKDNCKWNIFHTCKVCELVNNDSTNKRVCYCSLCSSYICKDHWKDYASRGLAALINVFKPKAKEENKAESEPFTMGEIIDYLTKGPAKEENEQPLNAQIALGKVKPKRKRKER